MKNSHSQTLNRRGFLKLGVGAGAAASMNLSSVFAQERPAWEARPVNPASVRPISIDMHTHWAPERYTKAQVEMGRPAPANPYPLDFDLDQRVVDERARRSDARPDAVRRDAMAVGDCRTRRPPRTDCQ